MVVTSFLEDPEANLTLIFLNFTLCPTLRYYDNFHINLLNEKKLFKKVVLKLLFSDIEGKNITLHILLVG